MKYKQIQPRIDLNDPEQGFGFATEGDGVRLWFTDWRNRTVTLSFRMVYWFSHRLANGFRGLPQGEALEILESEAIKSFRDDGTASLDEELHHYIISTNEGEWCEVVSEGVEIQIDC